jgi:hypothetical protein
MRRQAILLMATMVSALIVASGVALAESVTCDSTPPCYGTSEGDIINGTSSGETIKALGGNDQVFAAEGNDTVCGLLTLAERPAPLLLSVSLAISSYGNAHQNNRA